MLFDKNNPCYRTILFSHRIILFFRRSQCSLTKTTLLQNHSSLANRTILFVRRSRCFLTKTTLLQNHSSLANRTILFFRRSRCSLTKTTPATEPFYSRAELSYSFADHNALWQKQPCCKTILVSQTEQSYSFADHDAFWQKQPLLQNHSILAQNTIVFFRRSRCSLTKTTPAAEPCYSRAEQSYSFADYDAIPFGKNNPAAEPFYSRTE